VLANPSAEKLFDITANIESRALNRLVRCEKLIELLTDARRRKTPNNRVGEIEIPDKDGSAHWYSVTARSIGAGDDVAGADHTASGAVAVLRDISNQKASQRRNAEFVSAVSHEMKTPLAGIKAYVELLVDGDAEDEETREEFLGVINSQADRLQRLIDNMLNLARIEAGVVSVSKQSRSLNELLEEAFRVASPSAEAKDIQLVTDLSPLYLGVLVDRDMMSQAAINLLSNAIKYTPRGGKVTLRSRSVGDEVRFEVEDTGVGLSSEDCHKVFEKFYRVQKDKDMAAGTGLGLPLAKHIVEDVHGGKLTVESVLGQGSTFGVTLQQASKGSKGGSKE
jgi:two-component system phosphate regulon sensor histidine kinase PhoR